MVQAKFFTPFFISEYDIMWNQTCDAHSLNVQICTVRNWHVCEEIENLHKSAWAILEIARDPDELQHSAIAQKM